MLGNVVRRMFDFKGGKFSVGPLPPPSSDCSLLVFLKASVNNQQFIVEEFRNLE